MRQFTLTAIALVIAALAGCQSSVGVKVALAPIHAQIGAVTTSASH